MKKILLRFFIYMVLQTICYTIVCGIGWIWVIGAFIGMLCGYLIGSGDRQAAYDKGYREAIELRIDFSQLED